MNVSKLTDYQLYELIYNAKLDCKIRRLANEEFKSRNLPAEQIQELIYRHDSQFKTNHKEGIQLPIKIFLILFPFLLPVLSALAAKWLGQGQKRKWKQYWFYISIGYAVWTVITILYSKYIFS